MKYLKIIALAIICSYSSYLYAETQREKEITNKQSLLSKEKTHKKNTKKQQKQWPPTFIPSEKINADSSVSFPVDI